MIAFPEACLRGAHEYLLNPPVDLNAPTGMAAPVACRKCGQVPESTAITVYAPAHERAARDEGPQNRAQRRAAASKRQPTHKRRKR